MFVLTVIKYEGKLYIRATFAVTSDPDSELSII